MLTMWTRRWVFLIAVIAVVLLVDQVTKRLVVESLAIGQSHAPVPALGEVFRFTRSANTGSAFGFLPQAGDIFLVIAIVVTTAIIFFYSRLREPAWLIRFGMGLVCGGALGNALDRIEYGHVVDFIHYRIPGVVSNVSNLADHAIVFGVILIYVQSWRAERARKREAVETGEASEAP